MEPKEYERSWKQKNTKEIGNKRISKKLESKVYQILRISGHSGPK
jgi:hypothetical protein